MIDNVGLNKHENYDLQKPSVSEKKEVKSPVSEPQEESKIDAAYDSLGRAFVNGCQSYNVQAGFKPAKSYKDLKKQLENYKNSKGELVLKPKEIENILNSENDIKEISLILNNLQMRKYDLSGYQLQTLLGVEGITNQEIDNNFELLDVIKTSENFKTVDNPYMDFDVLCKGRELGDIKAEDIDKKLAVLKSIDNVCPDYSKNFDFSNLKQILATDVKPETIDRLSSLVDDLDIHDCQFRFILPKTDKEFNSQIDFVKDLISEPRLAHTLKDEEFKKDFLSQALFYTEIPEDFSLKENSEMVDLLNYAQNDEKLSSLFGNNFEKPSRILAILTKQNITIDEGKEFLNTLADANSEVNLPSGNISNFIKDANYQKATQRIKQILSYNEMDSSLKESLIGKFLSYDIDDTCADRLFYFIDKYNELGRINDVSSFGISLYTSEEVEEGKKQGADILKDYYPKEKVDKLFDELSDLKGKLSPKNWDCLALGMEHDIKTKCKIEKLNINLEMLKYIDEMEEWADKNNESVFLRKNLYEILQKTYDVDALKKNKDAFVKMIQLRNELGSNKLTGNHQFNFVGYGCQFAALYEGDLEKVYNELKKISEEYPNPKSDNICIGLSKDDVNISFMFHETGRTGNITRTYSPNMELLKESEEYIDNSDRSNRVNGKIVKDNKLHQEHNIIQREMSLPGASGILIPSKVTTVQKDDNGNIVKTIESKESSVPGVYDIREIYPNGEVKILSSVVEDENGLTIQKDLPSFDGTMTQIRYNEKENGNDEYSYKIIDKDGNVLTSQSRSTEKIDENSYINYVNDKKYKVTHSDTTIEIFDYSKNESKTIDLKVLNPGRNQELSNVLKTMDGDELWQFGERIKSINVVNRIESAIDPVSGKLYCGPHKFIIEHELGHGKDGFTIPLDELQKKFEENHVEDELLASYDYRRISSDENLRKIYLEEREQLLNNLSSDITDEAAYFLSMDNHYAGKWGGLGEVIAETNALQTTPRLHPFLTMRSQLLQQYMPKTVAYLMNNYL